MAWFWTTCATLSFLREAKRNFLASTTPEACLLTTPEVENLTLGDPCVTRIGGVDSFDATNFTQQVFAESGEMLLTPLGEPKILTAFKRHFLPCPLGRGGPDTMLTEDRAAAQARFGSWHVPF